MRVTDIDIVRVIFIWSKSFILSDDSDILWHFLIDYLLYIDTQNHS